MQAGLVGKRVAHGTSHLFAILGLNDLGYFGGVREETALDKHGRPLLFPHDGHEARTANPAIAPAGGADETGLNAAGEQQVLRVKFVVWIDASRVVFEVARDVRRSTYGREAI